MMLAPQNEISDLGDRLEGILAPDTSPSKLTHRMLFNILESGLMRETSNGVKSCDDMGLEATSISAFPTPSKAEQDRPLWRCWQCGLVAVNERELADHIKVCEPETNELSRLLGCPFCPKDDYQSSDWPFPISMFNAHIREFHPDVNFFTCGYCLLDMGSTRLDELICHILLEHKLPWRPSPASLAYLRRDQLPHRVVTCMGCGWCTFVLRASNSVQPPTSLQGHLTECPFNGGRVNLAQLNLETFTSERLFNDLTSECDQLSQSFAQTFPLVRGYLNESPLDTPKQLNLHYRSISGANCTTTAPATTVTSNQSPKKRPVARKSFSKSARRPKASRSIKPPRATSLKPSRGGAEVQFDVPINLPPLQPGASHKKASPTCLYVCPLCGDNALASLRQRDEHLQSAHNGELVFPCQVCGLAYPLYIALRRHAVLKHNADYDLVRYGPPELLDAEPVECPECHLVAFTDRSVLNLHLAEIHKMVLQPQPSKRVVRGESKKSALLHSDVKSDGTTHKNNRSLKRKFTGVPKEQNTVASKPKVKTEKRRFKPPSLSRLEVLLGAVSGEPAPMSCRLCRTTVDNAKEFKLHLELDHAETEECEQLGCQACGRIFFGSGGRIDLIGHLRVLHQDADQSSALSCPYAERKSIKITEDGLPVHVRPCEALFSSPRLRQIHSSTSGSDHPHFACPLTLELPDCENADALDLSEQLRAAIMETESAADREGLMILAYCCPNCSRLFAGFQAPVRFAAHRLACQVEPRALVDHAIIQPVASLVVQPPVITTIATATTTTETRPSTKLLESVLRQEPLIPIRR